MEQEKVSILKTVESIDFENIQKHPNILIAARLWDDDRYRAAKVCYKFMRRIDDLIDDRKSMGVSIPECEKKILTQQINDWIACIRANKIIDEAYSDVVEVIHRFHIPLSIFQSFANAMLFDIENNGFETYTDFVSYAQGASVAPASVFVHLCCLNSRFDGYVIKGIDPVQLARPCAMFSYLVHIIRDFEADQKNHLNYFPRDMMRKYGLTASDLSETAHSGVPATNFRHMVADYYSKATGYKSETEKVMEQLLPELSLRSKASLEVVFDLYKMVYERIEPQTGAFTKDTLNPAPHELKSRVLSIISDYTNCE